MIVIVGVIVSPAEQAPLPPRLLSFKSRARRVAATPFDVAEGRLSILELSLFPYFRIKRRQERQRWRRSVCTVLSFLSWPSSPFSSNVAATTFIFFLNFLPFYRSHAVSFACLSLLFTVSLSPRCVACSFSRWRAADLCSGGLSCRIIPNVDRNNRGFPLSFFLVAGRRIFGWTFCGFPLAKR